MMQSQSWKSPPTEAEDGTPFSPLVSASSIDHFRTKPRIRARPRPKTPEYYTVYHACGYDTSCLLNPFDIVPTMKAKHPNKQKPPYLVITDTHVLKWHHLKLLNNTSFVEVYCTNTCCVLSPVDAAIYVDAIGGCASEDALLGLLHGFQERKSRGWYSDGSSSTTDSSDDENSSDVDSEHEKLETVSFRMIYRIPLAAFSPTFALEEKKSFSSNDSMDSCRMIKVPSWLWWYLDEKSENMGVCDLFSN